MLVSTYAPQNFLVCNHRSVGLKYCKIFLSVFVWDDKKNLEIVFSSFSFIWCGNLQVCQLMLFELVIGFMYVCAQSPSRPSIIIVKLKFLSIAVLCICMLSLTIFNACTEFVIICYRIGLICSKRLRRGYNLRLPSRFF